MTLRRGQLTALALPVLILLIAQTVLMLAYAIFVTFRMMGANYRPPYSPPATAASGSVRRSPRPRTCKP
ncbi:sodium/glutamate symporter [Burkholderia pyrrocinia]|uniref:sodium/glutamate symporter n=1 Tax=Burkholderia pyrrocinia TaxID=60550 RepID=UPI001FC8786A|nr:sodium/glutamate symporter [Burkholderia pyrrocinia]